MSIVIKEINKINKIYHNKSNEPFAIFGKLLVEYQNNQWEISEVLFDKKTTKKYDDEIIDFDDYIKREVKTVFYATENGELLGQIVIRANWNKFCYIEDIGIRAKSRGKGIGKKLLESAQEWAEKRNLNGFMLETHDTNLTACRFYMKNGFVLGGVDILLYNQLKNSDEKALFWYKNLV